GPPAGGADGPAAGTAAPPPIPDQVAFVEPEPVLAVRRPPARKGPAAADIPAPRKEPDPREPEPRRPEPSGREPGRPEPGAPEPSAPEPGEPERVENRGGAIYVLRNEPPPDS
ncbi:MAG: hypothetical protein ACRDOO_17805, partial [Actinomadura sp.]